MTFEEWFKQVYEVTDEEIVNDAETNRTYNITRMAWNASRENLRSWDI